jgi:hypothetical protein
MRFTRSFVAMFALALAPAAASAGHGHDGGQTIAQARGAAVGTTVTVRGTVTVPTGAFDGGFAIQQGNAGIYVLDPGDGVSRAIGREVEVTGTITDSSGLLAITPTDVADRGRGDRIEGKRTRTGDVGEATEGRLLRLKGTMVGDLVDDGPFGFKLDIDDGSGPIQIFLFPGTGIGTAGLVDGARLEVTCFSNQFEVFDECDPRQPSDLSVKPGHGHP